MSGNHKHCLGVNPDLFFATDDLSVAKAKAVCAECPHRQLCLDQALERNEYGVWGGTDEHERAVIRRRRARTLQLV